MSTIVSKYFGAGKSSGKRKQPSTSSTSSVSDSCVSPDSDSRKPKQDRKKQRQDCDDRDTEDSMEVQEALMDIRQQFENLVTKDDVLQLKEEMAKMMDRLDGRMEKLEGEVFELKNDRDGLSAKVKKLAEENKELRGQVEQCRREERAVRRDINDHEQHGRQFNVRVYGVPEVQGKQESVEDCVLKCTNIFTSKVGVPVKGEDIEIAHRVGKAGGARPRPILVRFLTRRLRGRVLADRKRLKQSGVSVSEDLTLSNYKLLKKANDHSATLAAWSSNGKILVKTKNGQTIKLDIEMNVDEVLARAM